MESKLSKSNTLISKTGNPDLILVQKNKFQTNYIESVTPGVIDEVKIDNAFNILFKEVINM